MNSNEWIGSRWWKFDFHNHTPVSEDYGKGPNQAAIRKTTEREWLLAYMKAGIDCVAVTDHNSGAWVDSLKNELSKMKDEKVDGYRDLYLFPGVELTVQGNIHFLAIFDLDKKTSDIDALLGAVAYHATKGKSDGCSEKSAIEVMAAVEKVDGLVIAAHVDKPSGLFVEAHGGTLEQIVKSKHLSAIEVIDRGYKKPEIYIQTERNLSEVLGSDSHHLDGSPGKRFPGSAFTWLKMSRPSLDGVRLALMDGPLSVRRSDEYPDDQNTHADLVIEKISVQDAKYLGRGSPIDIQLNPWLNTIVGGRGSGKTTFLEFLRLALDRLAELPDSLRSDFERYAKVSEDREDGGLLLSNTKIVVVLRKDGVRFRITWSEQNRSIERQNDDGEWGRATGDIGRRFPARIYGQKQIFEIAKNPQALLQIVDDSEVVNGRDWRETRSKIFSRYMESKARERSIAADMGGLQQSVGELEDVRTKIANYEKSGYSEVLRDYQTYVAANAAVDSWQEQLGGSRFAIEQAIASLSFKTPLGTGLDGEWARDLNRSVDRVNERIGKARDKLLAAQTEMREALAEWSESRPGLEISKRYEKSALDYQDLMSKMALDGVDGTLGFAELIKRKIELESRVNSFSELNEILRSVEKESRDLLRQLIVHRKELTAKRTHFLDDVLKGNKYVKIAVDHMGALDGLESEFREIIGKGVGFDKDVGSVESGEGIIGELAKNKELPFEGRLEELVSWLNGVRLGVAKELVKVKDKRFANHIQSMADEQFDRLASWMPEDLVSIQYRLGTGSMRPVEQASPGQKTAALLAFILSYGREPLVLDQPEDDLDNHLIYDLIVTQLREIKSKRQILIVTHNANIVVNGDSENVVVLGIRAGQSRIIQQGGLQSFDIRNEVCNVMEGGRKAFDLRYKRISVEGRK